MNTTRETIDPAMRAAAQDICGDYSDIVPNDTRNLMGFFVSLRRLMMEVLLYPLRNGWRNVLTSLPILVRRQRFYIYRSHKAYA
jgi:hypothetical protein